MEKVYVTEGELRALDDSIEKHRKKQKYLDSGKKSYILCTGSDCPCCIHAGYLINDFANCYKCAIGKAGYKGCVDTGWCCMMRKKTHKALIDKLIEIREHCVIM